MPQMRFQKNRAREGSFKYADVSFYSADDLPVTPDAVRYRIDCLTTQKVVRDWTTVTPAQSVRIVIRSDDMRIIDDQNVSEDKQLVVEASGADGTTREVEVIPVDNLFNVT